MRCYGKGGQLSSRATGLQYSTGSEETDGRQGHEGLSQPHVMPPASARGSPGRRPSQPWANHRRTGLTSPTRVWATQAKTASGRRPWDSALGASSGSRSSRTASGSRIGLRRDCWGQACRTGVLDGPVRGQEDTIPRTVLSQMPAQEDPVRRPVAAASHSRRPPRPLYWPRRRAARPQLQLRPLAHEEMGFGSPTLIICIVTFPGERQSETVWAT